MSSTTDHGPDDGLMTGSTPPPPPEAASKFGLEMEVTPRDDRPSFFRIFFDGRTTKYLKIPEEFVQRYLREETSPTATLKGPTGASWVVDLCKNRSGSLFLRDGWQQFCRDHRLSQDDFMFFKYEGNMCFEVRFFDKSCVIRSYEPFEASTSKKVNASADVQIKEEEEEEGEEEEACRRADDPADHELGSSSFPRFKVCLTKSTMKVKLLKIPTAFAQQYLPGSKTTMTLSRSSAEKCWEVTYLGSQGNNTSLSSGWGAFLKDNQIEVGDTCWFELVAPTRMQVHVFH